MKFAQSLKAAVEKSGITQTELAKKLAVSRNYLSAILAGREKPPTIDRCEQIFEVLNLTKKESEALIKMAMIERSSKEMRPILERSFSGSVIPLTEDIKDYAKIPLLGKCPASAKAWVSDEVEGWHYFPKQLVRGRRLYLLKAHGDSMNRAGIDNGDLVIVDADAHPANGRIVVVCIDHEYTIKRFHRSGTSVTLSPDSYNQEHSPTIFDIDDYEIHLRGVVEAIHYKKLK